MVSYYQQIYNFLRQAGISEAGALGILGNWDCESNCEPGRLQGDFSPYRTASKSYVAALNNGSLTAAAFANDQKGFGLAQWTYPARKLDLYQTWKASGRLIDSAEFQVSFALKEFQRDFPADLQYLKTTTDVYEAAKVVCVRFENPAVHNVNARYQAALRIKQSLVLDDYGEATDPEPAKTDDDGNLIEKTWPPRTLHKGRCSGWKEIKLLQALLCCHGYNVLIDGIFGDELEEKTKAFQSAAGLAADGIVGPLTWGKLLER